MDIYLNCTARLVPLQSINPPRTTTSPTPPSDLDLDAPPTLHPLSFFRLVASKRRISGVVSETLGKTRLVAKLCHYVDAWLT
jgi:hypothetical protein